MTLSPRYCFCGNFPELQEKFIADVSAQRREDPLAPLTVIVSGHLVGLALKRELAWAGCSFANVRFRTLGDFAGELAEQTMTARRLRKLNDVTRDAVMARAVELCGPLDYFGKISSREGFRRAAWKTLDSLRSAGLTRRMIQPLADRLTHPLYHTLHRKLSDLLAIWESLERCMTEHRFTDSGGILDLATQAVQNEAGSVPIILYGLTELSELERRFVESLLKGRDATVFLPYRESRACEWVLPLCETFRSWGFIEEPLPPKPVASALLSRVQLGLFEEITPSEFTPASDEASLLVVSAPIREREAEETVRSVLYSPLAESRPSRSTAVLVRASEPYTGLLRSSFAQAGVSGYFHECQTFAATVTGRALKLLALLLDEKFRRVNVMEFLLSAPVRWPEPIPDPLLVLPAAEWNQFSMLAGIVSGRETWRQRLTRLHNRFIAEQERALEDEEAEQTIHAERLHSLDAMIRYTDYLFSRIAEINKALTWQDAVTALWSLLCELTEEQEETATLLEKLHSLQDLDALRAPLTPENLRLRISTVLAQSAKRADRFQVHEPTIAPMATCAGILFDEVIIPGMVEKEIPRPIPADPLLLDDERDTLQKLLDPRLLLTIPTFRREHEREMFVFHTALCSARRRVVLSYPRRDESSSRDRLPSTYLLKAVEAVRAETTDYAGLEAFISATPHGRRIPASRLRSSRADRATTSFQYHEAMLGVALETKSCRPLLYLIEDHPSFARAVDADQQRFRVRGFTRYDGIIEDPDLRQEFRKWHLSQSSALVASRLEHYAECPFRYFVRWTLDVHPVVEPPEMQRVTPYERAILMRDILDLFHRQESVMGTLPLKPDSLPRLQEIANTRFARFERESNTGVYLLWQIDRDRMMRALNDFAAAEIADSSGYVPTFFGRTFVVKTGEETALVFKGKLDRIDLTRDGTARVIMYRTGKPRGKSGSLLAGQALHLPVFRLAGESVSGGRVVSAADVYVTSGPTIKRTEYNEDDWDLGRENFLHVAATIQSQIVDGLFFPFPEKVKCGKCPVRAACGAGRMTPKWNYDLEETRAFRSFAEAT